MQAKKISVQGRGESRCIYCGQPKPGLPVREDNVIRCVRWFNRKMLRKYRNYRLVVCRACYPGYKKARSRYVKKQATYLIIGFLFAGLLVAVSGGSGFAFIYGAAIVAFMYALSLVSYVPALDVGAARPARARPAAAGGTNKLK